GLERLSKFVAPGLFASKRMSILAHSGSLRDAYLLRRCVYLKEELDMVLDRSWIEEGLSKLELAAVQQDVLAPLGARSARVKVAALESCCYLRNQLLRDADWAGMAHGVEIRVPFVDRMVLETLGPAIASERPPRKRDLAALSGLPPAASRRRKTGFVTPALQWATGETLATRHGLKNWSDLVWRRMRMPAKFPTGAEKAFPAATLGETT
ncbi:MAG: asparagine synthase-related protein, partial [Rhizomicrobium sp.]